MNEILNLREKRAAAVASAREILGRAVDGILSGDDTAAYDKAEAEIVALGQQIERLERQSAMDAAMAQPTSAPITTTPGNTRQQTGRASEEYRAAFLNAMRGRGASNVLSEGVDADGGFLLPTEFETALVRALTENNVVRQLAKVFTTAAERKIPVQGTAATATWTAENAPISEAGLTFDQKSLDAYKLASLIKVSNELLNDSFFNLEQYIAEELGQAFGVKEEEAFCVGDGVGKPTGIFTTNGGSVGVTTSGAAISADDLISLTYALKSPYRRNAKFLLNDATIASLRKLKDANGAYLWQPSLQAGEPDRLLGYELHTSPYAPTVASGALAAAFGDFSHYWIADRQGLVMQRLNELYSANDQVGIKATKRLDAKTILTEGIQLLKIAGSAAP